MKTILLTLMIGFGFVLPAFAATQVDANGDGMLTVEEVQAVYPEITAEAFSAMDVNADGGLDADEVAAAQEAGLMPAREG
jgi:hypothetical protein